VPNEAEGEKKGENYGVSPFSDDDVDFCAGFVSEQEVRASESSEAGNERDVFLDRKRENQRTLRDSDFQYASEHSLQHATK
jgi:hypothetical protein